MAAAKNAKVQTWLSEMISALHSPKSPVEQSNIDYKSLYEAKCSEFDSMKHEMVSELANTQKQLCSLKVILQQNNLSCDADLDQLSGFQATVQQMYAQESKAMRAISFGELCINDTKAGVLGRGSFGEVRKATWNHIPVAVKILHESCASETSSVLVDFKHELSVLVQLHHPNLVTLIGACIVPPNLCLVMENMNQGSLYDQLHKKSRVFANVELKSLILDMLYGLQYLHAKGIMHRDLKSQNILTFGNSSSNSALPVLHAKIADFGLAKTMHHASFTQTAHQGTSNWMAPEVMTTAPQYSFPVDVWGTSMIMYEMITNLIPFKLAEWYNTSLPAFQLHNVFVDRVCHKRETPPWPSNKSVDPYLKQVVESCWEYEPLKRPTCAQLITKIEQWIPTN